MTYPVTAAATLLLNQYGEVLILRRGHLAPWMAGFWNLPGGTIEYGETWREAAMRETYEETGLRVKPKPFGQGEYKRGRWRVAFFLEGPRKWGRVKLNYENDAYDWVSRRTLDDFLLIPTVRQALLAAFDAFDKQARRNPKKRDKVGNKIRLLMREGYPHKQAVAIALSMRDRAKLNRSESQRLKLRKGEWSVRPVAHKVAKQFMRKHHYAGGAGNTSVLAMGLFQKGNPEVQGVAIWLPPMGPAARYAARELDVPADEVLALSRLAIAPDVPSNAASFLLGRSVRHLRRDPRWSGAITWADAGKGHRGQIYKATNWIPAGKTKPRRLWVDKKGRLVSPRTGPSGNRRNLRKAEMLERGYRQLPPSFKYRFLTRL